MPRVQLPAVTPKRKAWNKGRIIGQKRPLLPKQVWAIRARLELAGYLRDLALFNVAIDSKLRGCDLVKLAVPDLVKGNRVRGGAFRCYCRDCLDFGDDMAGAPLLVLEGRYRADLTATTRQWLATNGNCASFASAFGGFVAKTTRSLELFAVFWPLRKQHRRRFPLHRHCFRQHSCFQSPTRG